MNFQRIDFVFFSSFSSERWLRGQWRRCLTMRRIESLVKNAKLSLFVVGFGFVNVAIFGFKGVSSGAHVALAEQMRRDDVVRE